MPVSGTDLSHMNHQPNKPDYLLLGRILRPHGVVGEIRMSINSDFPERFVELEQVYLGTSPEDPKPTPIQLKKVRFHQSYALVTFQGISDRNEADTLRGKYVLIDMDHAVPLEEDEYYLYQLIGMEVFTVDEQALGSVREVLETGANDVYVLDSPKYGELLIPAHSETIVDIDIDKNRIVVNLPDGLLPEA